MSRLIARSNQFKIALLAAILSLALSGCHWFSGKKGGKNHFINRDSIVLDRIEDGSSARLAFKTKAEAFCELRVWSQEEGKNPTKSEPRFLPCSNKEPQTDFVELIADLSIATLYVIEVSAWRASQSKGSGDRVTVNEGDGAGKELFVVRLNSPLHTAELHRFSSSEAIKLNDLKNDLHYETGCQAGIPERESKYSKSSSFEGDDVESVGYAVAEVKPHPDYSQIKRLDYNEYHPEQGWRFVIGEGDDEYSFAARQAGELYEVKAVQTEETRIEQSSLNHPTALVRYNPDQELEFQWSSNTTSEIAYVIVQVGHVGEAGSFQCVFDASLSSGTIPAQQFLANLDSNKKYDATITLYTAQVQLFPSEGRSTWLITSYDWRTAVFEHRT